MDNNKILLVDDELNIRETITELLTLKMYEVKTAVNGQEALAILEFWKPDLILCDVLMPVMDGTMLHEIIKNNSLLSAIPFIFLTAKREEHVRQNYVLDSVDGFLSKPFKIKELLSIIKVKIERFAKIKNAYCNLYIGKRKYFTHEVNTPLNGILCAVDVLIDAENKLNKKDIPFFYDAIKASGERLHRTMQNLLLYQDINNNIEQYSDRAQTEILDRFLSVKAKIIMNNHGERKRIVFEIEKRSIKMRAKHLDFIIFELIDNALKFSKCTQSIQITGKLRNQDYYELVIQDFGVGFSQEELTKIEPGTQFHREVREQQGLGLGLYLSKIITLQSDGAFTIISSPNDGAKVRLLLPLAN